MKRLLLATVLFGCANPPPQEKIMKLEMETKVDNKRDQTVVTASLRNSGTEPVKVLLEFMMHDSFTILRDAEGPTTRRRSEASRSSGSRSRSRSSSRGNPCGLDP